jgi:hypothetical protein
MSAIRVSIGGMPKLLSSFVAGILGVDPEIEIVDGDGTDVPDWEGGVHVLLVAEEAMSQLRPFGSAWQAGSALGVVALSENGSEAQVVRLVTQNWKIDDADKISLAEAIRYAAGAIRGNA